MNKDKIDEIDEKEKRELLWKEYQMLHDEIRGADALNYQILAIIIGAIGVIITAGIGQVNPLYRVFIFICPYMITIPGYLLLVGNRRRTWRLTTYIRVFLEPELKFINWETRLDSQRKFSDNKNKKARKNFSSLISTNEWLIVSLMNVFAGLATIIALLVQNEITNLIRNTGIAAIIVFNVLLIIVTSWQEMALRRSKKFEAECLKSWLDIRNGKTSN